MEESNNLKSIQMIKNLLKKLYEYIYSINQNDLIKNFLNKYEQITDEEVVTILEYMNKSNINFQINMLLSLLKIQINDEQKNKIIEILLLILEIKDTL